MDHDSVQKQLVKINVPTFDGDERKYHSWKWKLGLKLLPFGLKFLLASEVFTGNKAEREFYIFCAVFVSTAIIAALPEKFLEQIRALPNWKYQDYTMECPHPAAIMNLLKNIYEPDSSHRLIEIENELKETKMIGTDFSTYESRLRNLFAQQEAQGVTISEASKFAALLNGLEHDSYLNSFLTVVDMYNQDEENKKNNKRFSFEKAVQQLTVVYGRKKSEQKLDHVTDDETIGGVVNALNNFSISSGKQRAVRLKKNYKSNDLHCTKCGKDGHTIDDCFVAHPCQICGGTNHATDKCWKKRLEGSQQICAYCTSDKHSQDSCPIRKKAEALKKIQLRGQFPQEQILTVHSDALCQVDLDL